MGREIALVVAWYELECGLTAAVPSLIRFEPECKDEWGLSEYIGFARLSEHEQCGEIVDVCIRLDANDESALESGLVQMGAGARVFPCAAGERRLEIRLRGGVR